MRFTRTYLASLGASILLIGAGSLALFAVSAFVAFNGWPGVDAVPVAGSQTAVAVLPAAQRPDATSEPVVMAAAPPRSAPPSPKPPARPAVKADPAPQPALVVTLDDVADPRPRARPAPVRTPAEPAPLPAEPVAAPEPEPTPRPADGVRQTTDRLGATVGGVVDGLGDVVAPITPALDVTLDQVGRLLHDTVAGLGVTVGAVVDGLLQPRP